MKNILQKTPAIILIVLAFALSCTLATHGIETALATKIAAWTCLTLLLLGALYLLFDKDALRDNSDQLNNDKPYSFSRVQLWWWTLVILGSFLGIYAATGNCWPMNSTCLVLLGISLTTTVSGRMIDTQQTNDATVVRSQNSPSQGILHDILSDENGLSMHRFQALVFNIAYGLSFIVTVFSDPNNGKFPTYDPTVLTLLGVSSGAYLAMKINENKTNTNQVAVPAQQNQGGQQVALNDNNVANGNNNVQKPAGN